MICSTSTEDSKFHLICPKGQIINSISFASFGTPTGADCKTFKTNPSCNAATSLNRVQLACLKQSECTIYPTTNFFNSDPCPGVIKNLRVVASCVIGSVTSGYWTDISNNSVYSIYNPLLLTDGRVLGFNTNDSRAYILTPDRFGNYANGYWTRTNRLPISNPPLFFSSAVLPSGKVIISGGKNGQKGLNTTFLFDPVTNNWTSLIPPPSFLRSPIGNAPSIVLPNGQFLVGLCHQYPALGALLDSSTFTWTELSFKNLLNRACNNEGWTLLPNGNILTVPVNNSGQAIAEIYNPVTDTWTLSGKTVNQLSYNGESGPALLMPNGKYLAIGASGQTAIYDTTTSTWHAGTPLPVINGQRCRAQSSPAAVLPNGNILYVCATGSGFGTSAAYFFETDGTIHRPLPPAPRSALPYSYNTLVLPSGQILLAGFNSSGLALYTPSSSQQIFNSSWRPVLLSITNIHFCPLDTNIQLTGYLFNGMTSGAAYGDGTQAATNYPLVRITNTASGFSYYSRTKGHSAMVVQGRGKIVTTLFDVNHNVKPGFGTLTVVVNGIPSLPLPVKIFTCS